MIDRQPHPTLARASLLAIGLLGGASPAFAHGHEQGPKHIFVIMMENHGTDEIIGNTADAPFINGLVKQNGVSLATQYFGVTHPSLPNYLAAISGDTQGIFDDCKAGVNVFCAPEEFVPGAGDATDGRLATNGQVARAGSTGHWFEGRNVVDQVERSGRRWKAYMQSAPTVGFADEYFPGSTLGNGINVKLYAQKHNPFMYFADIASDGNPRLQNIVPFDGANGQFMHDLASNTMPEFVWISPDQCHDMHGMSPAAAAAVNLPACGFPDTGLDHGAIRLGDDFLQQTVGAIMNSAAWQEGAVILVAWDEDDYAGYSGCCGSPEGRQDVTLGGARAPAIVITSSAGAAQKIDTPLNHYSLLAAVQDAWHLGCLGHTCGLPEAARMTPLLAP